MMRQMPPNPKAPPNPASASPLEFGHHPRGVGEPGRWGNLIALMRILALSFALISVFTACHKTETEQVGGLADIPERVRPQAEAALRHAGRFISTAAVDTAKLDLSNPQIFRPSGLTMPDRSPDWWVIFPWVTRTSTAPYGIRIAVRNDGTCWILK